MGWIIAGAALAFVAYHARDLGIKVVDLRKKRGGDGDSGGNDEAGSPAVPVGPRPSRSASAVMDPPATHEG